MVEYRFWENYRKTNSIFARTHNSYCRDSRDYCVSTFCVLTFFYPPLCTHSDHLLLSNVSQRNCSLLCLAFPLVGFTSAFPLFNLSSSTLRSCCPCLLTLPLFSLPYFPLYLTLTVPSFCSIFAPLSRCPATFSLLPSSS